MVAQYWTTLAAGRAGLKPIPCSVGARALESSSSGGDCPKTLEAIDRVLYCTTLVIEEAERLLDGERNVLVAVPASDNDVPSAEFTIDIRGLKIVENLLDCRGGRELFLVTGLESAEIVR